MPRLPVVVALNSGGLPLSRGTGTPLLQVARSDSVIRLAFGAKLLPANDLPLPELKDAAVEPRATTPI
jgi:hypothetical protein